MSEEDAKQEAREDAAWFRQLLDSGVSIGVATQMWTQRIMARCLSDAVKPKREPWER